MNRLIVTLCCLFVSCNSYAVDSSWNFQLLNESAMTYYLESEPLHQGRLNVVLPKLPRPDKTHRLGIVLDCISEAKYTSAREIVESSNLDLNLYDWSGKEYFSYKGVLARAYHEDGKYKRDGFSGYFNDRLGAVIWWVRTPTGNGLSLEPNFPLIGKYGVGRTKENRIYIEFGNDNSIFETPEGCSLYLRVESSGWK